ncbi:ATP-binding cassette domain-containing protein, partial [Clostridioides difficile]
RGFNKSDTQTHVIEIMQELKISKWSHVQGQKLSGGLQRLTSFAMSIVAPPPILLLDEPTNDVDPIRRKII